jgi:hypothetical protein
VLVPISQGAVQIPPTIEFAVRNHRFDRRERLQVLGRVLAKHDERRAGVRERDRDRYVSVRRRLSKSQLPRCPRSGSWTPRTAASQGARCNPEGKRLGRCRCRSRVVRPLGTAAGLTMAAPQVSSALRDSPAETACLGQRRLNDRFTSLNTCDEHVGSASRPARFVAMGDNATSQERAALVEVGDCINLPSPSIISPVMQLFDAYLGAAWALSCACAEYFKRTAKVLRSLPPKKQSQHRRISDFVLRLR